MNLTDYQSISLIGCMYKMIAKVLVSRVKYAIGGVSGEVKSTHMEGRNILDDSIIIKELCSWVK